MKHRSIALCIVLALASAACGSRVEEDSADPGPGGQFSTEDTGTGDTGGTGDTTGDGGGSEPGMFGTLESPCGPGDASGETETGVTDDKIVVATIADPGGPIPGLNQGIHDSMKAFAQWCNAQGGINGRELEVQLLDAKLGEYKQRVLEACDSAFALVGGLGVFDESGAQDQVDCGLVNVPAAAVSPKQVEADLTYAALPNPVYTYQAGAAQWLADQHPDAITKAGAIYSATPVTERQSKRLQEAYEQVGFSFVANEVSDIGETSWDPIVLSLKDADVEYITLTSSYEEIIGLQKAMSDQDFHPIVELEANFYNDSFPSTDGAEGTYVRLPVWPFEEKDENPAMATYLEALFAAVPDAKPELLGAEAFASGLLFATAAKAAGSDLTRATLEAELQKITEWDSGGMHGTTNPSENVPSPCFVVMQVVDGAFVRAYPLPDEDAEVFEAGDGFACPDDGLVELTGDYGSGAKKSEG
jgi:ABC-type branched-subunit amino acid transport system substrate-binding protein